jgi:DNA polymerase-3 subunit delta
MAASKKKSPLLPAYLIVGTNELMSKEAVARLKARLEPGLDVFNLDEFTANSDLSAGDLVASLNTVAMGTGPRIVFIMDAERLPKAVSEALIGYLKNPNPGCTACLVAHSLARTTRLYKAIDKIGPHAVINCGAQKRWELPKTVQRMGKVHGIILDDAAAQELIARVGESTVMLDAQVKSLAEFCRADAHVSRSDVCAHIVRTAEVKPWDFLDAICARDTARALSLYHLMIKPSQIALTSLITGRVRELICARALIGRGCPQTLAQTLGKKDWQVKNHLGWAQHFSDADLERSLALAAYCERDLKAGRDSEITFTRFVLAICGSD